MAVFCEGAIDVAWHGYIDVSFVIIPVEVQAAVELAFPVYGDFVVGLEGGNEVVGIGFREILDAEVVDTECKCCFS